MSQWFYFAVTNTPRDRTVTFNILNCTKSVPLFKQGMKPLSFSEVAFESHGTEWTVDTENVAYSRTAPAGKLCPTPNFVDPVPSVAGPQHFTLSFSYTFTHSDDRVYFAYSRPYPTTRLRQLLFRVREALLGQAKTSLMLEQDGLQLRIKDFVRETDARQAETLPEHKRRLQPEDQFRTMRRCGKPVPPPESALVASDVLKEYASQEKGSQFVWLKSQDYQIETESFIFRKETLSHTLSGFPVELITITAYR